MRALPMLQRLSVFILAGQIICKPNYVLKITYRKMVVIHNSFQLNKVAVMKRSALYTKHIKPSFGNQAKNTYKWNIFLLLVREKLVNKHMEGTWINLEMKD